MRQLCSFALLFGAAPLRYGSFLRALPLDEPASLPLWLLLRVS